MGEKAAVEKVLGVGDIQDKFNTIDSNEDGQLDRDELTAYGRSTPANSVVQEVIKHFDEIRGLNDKKGSESNGIELADIDFLSDLGRESFYDKFFFEKSRDLALKNFEGIDADKDGKLTASEIRAFRRTHGGSEEDQSQLGYLARRADGISALSANGFVDRFARQNIVDNTAASGRDYPTSYFTSPWTRESLGRTIERQLNETRRNVYRHEFASDWSDAGHMVGIGIGVAGGMALSGGLLVPMGTGYVFGKVGEYAGGKYGAYRGGKFYDQNQTERMQRLFK
ncbi:MAG: hypothetical protein IPM23_14170 [Candidatus Melainabacteria bacterium]|nr:hypothetical protein [Candidatus Melainabacteria bacterium]